MHGSRRTLPLQFSVRFRTSPGDRSTEQTAAMPEPSTAAWTLRGHVATARVAGARIDLAAPDVGLTMASDDGADELLGLDLLGGPPAPADHWIRGTDLTGIYEPDDPRRLRATAMWRSTPDGSPAWELVVSAQTALLHADAALAVVSHVACAEAAWLAAGEREWRPIRASGPLPEAAAAVLARRLRTAVLVAVHPQDPRRIVVDLAGSRARIACGIFPAVIEKGVILRSRVLATVGPARAADEWAAARSAAFAATPPFLDT